MAELLRIVAWLMLSIGWLMMAATVPSSSLWRLLLALAALQATIGCLVLIMPMMGLAALSLRVRDDILTPVLFLMLFLQFAVMYRKDGVKR